MEYDYNELAKEISSYYQQLYYGRIEQRREWVEIGDKLLANKALFPLFAGLAEIRKDIFSSDRECAALALAINPWLLGADYSAEPATAETEKPATEKKANYKGTAKTYEIKHDYQHKGIEIYFDGIPSANCRDIMKGLGMRWHNVKKCWYGRLKENDLVMAIAPAI